MSQQKVDPRSVYVTGTTRLDKSQKTVVEQMNDAEVAKRVEEMKTFFDQFLRSLKNISIYRHNVSHFAEYMERAYKLLAAMLARYETVAIKVEQLGFKYFDEMIYQEDASEQNIAHKFYRDGVRILIFRNGLDPEQLLNFAMICLANFHQAEYMFEDMVSLMWKAEFPNIEYVVVETFAVGTETQEEAKAEIDKIVNYLYQQLTSQTEDRFQFARISLEDLEIELDDVEQAKGLVIKGSPAGPEVKARILQQLEEEDAVRALPKLVVIMLKLLEEDLDQDLGQALEDVFIQILDSFLMHEDFRGINQMLRKIRNLSRKRLDPANLARIEQIEHSFTTRMGEAERLGRLADILDTTAEIKEPQEVYRYLLHLDEQAILPLLQALERMERLEARRLICDALAVLGRDQLDVFSRRLQSEKANLVRDMVYVIDKIDPPDKLKYIAKLLEHPNLAIRLETLKTLGSSGEASCQGYVLQALADRDPQMRITAARLLVNFDVAKASRTLLTLVRDQNFIRRSDKEQAAIYATLALTNTPDATHFFREQLRSTSLLGKKKLAEHKKTVINGLALSGSIAAYKLLKAELEAGLKEEEVIQSAQRACEMLRGKLLGT